MSLLNYDILKEKVLEINLVSFLERQYHLEFNKMFALSPLTDEKTPSFTIYTHKYTNQQWFSCFSTGQRGNIYVFVMRKENLGYHDALKFIADVENIDLPFFSEKEAEKWQKKQNEKHKIKEALIFAQKDYFEGLLSDDGKDAREYLEKIRLYTPEDWKKFGLGFVRTGFLARAKKAGFTKSVLQNADLIKNLGKGNFIDANRGRISFVLKNEFGDIVGFSGRIFGDAKGAKYFNPKETAVYKKKSFLYGLWEAKEAIQKIGIAYITEGYTDVLSSRKAGVSNVVASSGTAFTPEQIELLIRAGVQKFRFVNDADKSGFTSTLKSCKALVELGYIPEVVPLPDGDDPDTFAKKNDFRGLAEIFEQNAKSYIDFFAEKYLAQANDDLQECFFTYSELFKIVTSSPLSEHKRMLWKHLNEKYGISPDEDGFEVYPKADFEQNDLSFFEERRIPLELAEKYGLQAIKSAVDKTSGKAHKGIEADGSEPVFRIKINQNERLLLTKISAPKRRYKYVAPPKYEIDEIFGYAQRQENSKILVIMSSPEDCLTLRAVFDRTELKSWDVIEYDVRAPDLYNDEVWDTLKEKYDCVILAFEKSFSRKASFLRNQHHGFVFQDLKDLDTKSISQLVCENIQADELIVNILQDRLNDYQQRKRVQETIGLPIDRDDYVYTRSTFDKSGKIKETLPISNFIIEETIEISTYQEQTSILLRLASKNGIVKTQDVQFTANQLIKKEAFRKKLYQYGLNFIGSPEELEKLSTTIIDEKYKCETLEVMGWADELGAWILSNAVIEQSGKIHKVDEYGLVKLSDNHKFKILPFSKENVNKSYQKLLSAQKILSEQRKYRLCEPYRKNGQEVRYSLQTWANALYNTFGITAVVVIAHSFLASISDFAFAKSGHLETVMLTGGFSQGKTTLCQAVAGLWGVDAPTFSFKRSDNTPAGFSGFLGKARCVMAVIDEFNNESDFAPVCTGFYNRDLAFKGALNNESTSNEITVLPIMTSNERISPVKHTTLKTRVIEFPLVEVKQDINKFQDIVDTIKKNGCSYLLAELAPLLAIVKKGYTERRKKLLKKYESQEDFSAFSRLPALVAQLMTPISIITEKIKFDFDLAELEKLLLEAILLQQQELLASTGENDFFETIKEMFYVPEYNLQLIEGWDYRTDQASFNQKQAIVFNINSLIAKYKVYKKKRYQIEIHQTDKEIIKGLKKSPYILKLRKTGYNNQLRFKKFEMQAVEEEDKESGDVTGYRMAPVPKYSRAVGYGFDLNRLANIGLDFGAVQEYDKKMTEFLLVEISQNAKQASTLPFADFLEQLSIRNPRTDFDGKNAEIQMDIIRFQQVADRKADFKLIEDDTILQITPRKSAEENAEEFLNKI